MANGEEKKTTTDGSLLDFEAYERPHKVWSKEFYSTVIVIAFLVSVILYFIEGIMPVVVIWALVFMLWAMAKTEPRLIKTSLTAIGIKSGEKTYSYDEMDTFWIETKWSSRLLRINLRISPWHIVSVINEDREDEIMKILEERGVVFQEPPVTTMDRALRWIGEKMPLE